MSEQAEVIPFICDVNINFTSLCPHCKTKVTYQIVLPGRGGDIKKLIPPKEPLSQKGYA